MDKLVDRLLRAPRLVLVGVFVAVVLCAPLMARLTDQVIPGGFEDPNSSAVTAEQILADEFDIPSNTFVAVVAAKDGLTAAADKVIANARELPGFQAALGYQDDPRLLAASEGVTAVQIMTTDSATEAVRSVKDVRTDLAEGLPAGATVRLTGEAALASDYNDQTAQDALLAESIAFPVLIILLLLVFRSVIAMLVPIVIGVLTLVAAQGVGGFASYFTDISNLYVNAVSIIGLAVSIDYSLFIMRRYTQLREGGMPGDEALRTAFRTTGRSVLFGGVIVMVSLAGLFIPNVMVLTSIAIAGIAATAVAMALTAVALPAVLALWGDKIFAGNRFLVRKRAVAADGEPAAPSKRSTVIGLVAAAVMVVLAAPIVVAQLQVPVASVDNLPADSESRVAAQQLADHLGVPREQPIDLVFRAEDGAPAGQLAAEVNRVADDLRTWGEVARVDHPAAPSPKAERLSVIPRPGASAQEQHELVGALEALEIADGTELYAGGVAVVGYDFDKAVMRSLPLLIGAVLILSLALLYWVFRSWTMAVCAVVLNNLVIGSAVGLLILIFQVGLDQPVSSMQPVLIFAVMFGMSMDYLIVMASRMREEYLGGAAHSEAVSTGLRVTTPVVTAAAAIMATVFLSFLVAKISIVAQLGAGLAIAVILDAVVLRRFVLPAVFRVIGPRLWSKADTARVEPAVAAEPELVGR
ncbi:MMPL family transporter [Nocardia sp. SSK8]|uniref:MMPL family transporter n=1 Tax=Nocardia sp. SSK8 TaxID=3120154 RepID=UPI003008A5C8